MSTIAAIADITSPPRADQHVFHNGKKYTTINEGLAYILIPASASKTPQRTPTGENQPQSVFYNPIQQFNRDLSVLAIKAYGEEVVVRKQKLKDERKENVTRKGSRKRKRREDGDGGRGGRGVDIERTEGANGPQDDTAQPAVVKESPRNGIEARVNAPSVEDGQENNLAHEEGRTTEPPPPVKQPATSTAAAPSGSDVAMSDADAQPKDSTDHDTANAQHQPSNQPAKPFIQPFTILDALSATGLRALRYVHEIPFTTSVTANDLLPAATESIKLNIKHNKLEAKIKPITGNALTHMYSFVGESRHTKDHKPSGKYDVIDLDPYGTAAPFLDAAVQSVRDDGGLLCVTCTDAGVWASNGYPEKSYSLYGGTSTRGDHCHENGLRLILHAIATSAARYGLAMEPLLSLSIDFYARIFVRIYSSPADVKFLAGKTMLVHNCDQGCGAWTTQMLATNKLSPNKNGKGHFWKHILSQSPANNGRCEHCGMKTHIAGPVYAGPLHNPTFIKKILDGLPQISKDTYATKDRIEGMLTLALEELLPPLEENTHSPTLTSKTHRYDPSILDNHPFSFIPSSLAKIVHCVTPHENAIRGALMKLGYRVTRSHTKAGSIKTDAPWTVVWEVMREWVRQKAPVKEKSVRKGTAGWEILRLGEKARSVEGPGAGNGDKMQDGGVENGEKRKLEVVFDEELGKQKDGRKLVRYQHNPRDNWGPMNRATGHA